MMIPRYHSSEPRPVPAIAPRCPGEEGAGGSEARPSSFYREYVYDEQHQAILLSPKEAVTEVVVAKPESLRDQFRVQSDESEANFSSVSTHKRPDELLTGGEASWLGQTEDSNSSEPLPEVPPTPGVPELPPVASHLESVSLLGSLPLIRPTFPSALLKKVTPPKATTPAAAPSGDASPSESGKDPTSSILVSLAASSVDVPQPPVVLAEEEETKLAEEEATLSKAEKQSLHEDEESETVDLEEHEPDSSEKPSELPEGHEEGMEKAIGQFEHRQDDDSDRLRKSEDGIEKEEEVESGEMRREIERDMANDGESEEKTDDVSAAESSLCSVSADNDDKDEDSKTQVEVTCQQDSDYSDPDSDFSDPGDKPKADEAREDSSSEQEETGAVPDRGDREVSESEDEDDEGWKFKRSRKRHGSSEEESSGSGAEEPSPAQVAAQETSTVEPNKRESAEETRVVAHGEEKENRKEEKEADEEPSSDTPKPHEEDKNEKEDEDEAIEENGPVTSQADDTEDTQSEDEEDEDSEDDDPSPLFKRHRLSQPADAPRRGPLDLPTLRAEVARRDQEESRRRPETQQERLEREQREMISWIEDRNFARALGSFHILTVSQPPGTMYNSDLVTLLLTELAERGDVRNIVSMLHTTTASLNAETFACMVEKLEETKSKSQELLLAVFRAIERSGVRPKDSTLDYILQRLFDLESHKEMEIVVEGVRCRFSAYQLPHDIKCWRCQQTPLKPFGSICTSWPWDLNVRGTLPDTYSVQVLAEAEKSFEATMEELSQSITDAGLKCEWGALGTVMAEIAMMINTVIIPFSIAQQFVKAIRANCADLDHIGGALDGFFGAFVSSLSDRLVRGQAWVVMSCIAVGLMKHCARSKYFTCCYSILHLLHRRALPYFGYKGTHTSSLQTTNLAIDTLCSINMHFETAKVLQAVKEYGRAEGSVQEILRLMEHATKVIKKLSERRRDGDIKIITESLCAILSLECNKKTSDAIKTGLSQLFSERVMFHLRDENLDPARWFWGKLGSLPHRALLQPVAARALVLAAHRVKNTELCDEVYRAHIGTVYPVQSTLFTSPRIVSVPSHLVVEEMVVLIRMALKSAARQVKGKLDQGIDPAQTNRQVQLKPHRDATRYESSWEIPYFNISDSSCEAAVERILEAVGQLQPSLKGTKNMLDDPPSVDLAVAQFMLFYAEVFAHAPSTNLNALVDDVSSASSSQTSGSSQRRGSDGFEAPPSTDRRHGGGRPKKNPFASAQLAKGVKLCHFANMSVTTALPKYQGGEPKPQDPPEEGVVELPMPPPAPAATSDANHANYQSYFTRRRASPPPNAMAAPGRSADTSQRYEDAGATKPERSLNRGTSIEHTSVGTGGPVGSGDARVATGQSGYSQRGFIENKHLTVTISAAREESYPETQNNPKRPRYEDTTSKTVSSIRDPRNTPVGRDLRNKLVTLNFNTSREVEPRQTETPGRDLQQSVSTEIQDSARGSVMPQSRLNESRGVGTKGTFDKPWHDTTSRGYVGARSVSERDVDGSRQFSREGAVRGNLRAREEESSGGHRQPFRGDGRPDGSPGDTSQFRNFSEGNYSERERRDFPVNGPLRSTSQESRATHHHPNFRDIPENDNSRAPSFTDDRLPHRTINEPDLDYADDMGHVGRSNATHNRQSYSKFQDEERTSTRTSRPTRHTSEEEQEQRSRSYRPSHNELNSGGEGYREDWGEESLGQSREDWQTPPQPQHSAEWNAPPEHQDNESAPPFHKEQNDWNELPARGNQEWNGPPRKPWNASQPHPGFRERANSYHGEPEVPNAEQWHEEHYYETPEGRNAPNNYNPQNPEAARGRGFRPRGPHPNFIPRGPSQPMGPRHRMEPPRADFRGPRPPPGFRPRGMPRPPGRPWGPRGPRFEGRPRFPPHGPRF